MIARTHRSDRRCRWSWGVQPVQLSAVSAELTFGSAENMEDISLSSLLLRGAAVILLIAANGFFVAIEFALVATRKTRIEKMVKSGDRKAKTVQAALQDLYRQLSAAQLGITVASILLGYVAEDSIAVVLHDWFARLPAALSFLTRASVVTVVAVSIVSFLHVVIGEQAPKTWAITFPETTSRWLAAPLIFFSWITRPITNLLNWSANQVIHLMGIKHPMAEHERVHSPEEIVMVVKQSRKSGHLQEQDVRLIEGVFEFTEKKARDVMTPRTEVLGLPAESSLDDAMDLITKAGRSRYPVYRESLDDIVGILHIKQILGALQQGRGTSVESIMRDVIYVPSTREVEDVLTDLKRNNAQMAVVLDEYGGTAGIVTMEDLLEEIVGEIYDEYEEAETLPPTGTSEITVSGDTEIADLNKRFALSITDTDYHTIGGYVFGKLGRLPNEGDRVQSDNLVVQVTAMDGRRVDKVKIVGLGKAVDK